MQSGSGIQPISIKQKEAVKLERGMRLRRTGFRKLLEEDRLTNREYSNQKTIYPGTDSDGKPVWFRRGIELKTIYLKNGLVSIKTGLKKGWAGKRVIGGSVEKESILDIYRALRLTIHIQEKLKLGKTWRDFAISEIEKINSRLYEFGVWGSPLWIYTYRKVIESLSDALKETINPLNSEAKKMLVDASESLAEASVTEKTFEKRKWISIACTKLTSFRIRLGEWREKQAEGMIRYNLRRECVLRWERDNRIKSELRRMITTYSNENKWAIFWKDQKDLRYAGKIGQIIVSKKRREVKIKMLRELKKEMEANKYRKQGKKFNLEILERAEEHYKNGENRLARKILRIGKLLLEVNKAEFIAKELEQSERYLLKVKEQVQMGEKHIQQLLKAERRGQKRAKELALAVECFRNALRKMETLPHS